MQSTKERIKKCVEEYIRLFPLEYEQFKTSTRIKQDSLLTEFAELKGDQMVRHLFDVPETLYYILMRRLTDEEMDWLYSRNAYERKRDGLTWFIRTFPQFRITKDF